MRGVTSQKHACPVTEVLYAVSRAGRQYIYTLWRSSSSSFLSLFSAILCYLHYFFYCFPLLALNLALVLLMDVSFFLTCYCLFWSCCSNQVVSQHLFFWSDPARSPLYRYACWKLNYLFISSSLPSGICLDLEKISNAFSCVLPCFFFFVLLYQYGKLW